MILPHHAFTSTSIHLYLIVGRDTPTSRRRSPPSLFPPQILQVVQDRRGTEELRGTIDHVLLLSYLIVVALGQLWVCLLRRCIGVWPTLWLYCILWIVIVMLLMGILYMCTQDVYVYRFCDRWEGTPTMRPYLGASRQPLDPLGVGMGSHPTGSPDSGRDNTHEIIINFNSC